MRCACAMLVTFGILTTMQTAAEVPADSPLRRAPSIALVPEVLPEPSLVATPEYALFTGWTRSIQHLRDEETLVVSSPGESGGSFLYFVNAADLSVERMSIPAASGAVNCAVVGQDGNLYFPPSKNGAVTRLDPDTRELTRFDIGYPEEELTWWAAVGANGRIYFGSYPTATFGEFDPVTSSAEHWQHTAPNARYATYLSVGPEGRIRFLACHPENQWLEFDPATREFAQRGRVGTPPRYCQPPFGVPDVPGDDAKFAHFLRTQTRFFTVSFPSGRLWEIVNQGEPDNPQPVLQLRGETGWPVEKWKLTEAAGAVVGIGDYGALFRFDLQTGAFTTGHLPNMTSEPSHVMYLETVSPRCVVLSPGIHKGFVLLDPQTGTFSQIYRMFHPIGVQGQCATGLDGTLFLGLYGGAVLMKLDPTKPYRWKVNPRELIVLADQYEQTRPRDATTDGRRVFFSSDGAYGVLGGAITVIDPAEDRITVYKHPIKDQNMPSLAWDPATSLLWGGTWRWGTSKSCPPTQPSSLLYAMQPDTGEVVFQSVLWPGSDTTYTPGVSQQGLLVATNGSRIALVHTPTREILYQGKMGMNPPTRLEAGRDGAHYFLKDGRMWRWNLLDNTVAAVARTPDCHLLTETEDGEWFLSGKGGIYKISLPR